ncbi:TetR/AcrR family transcriptional regulator [Bacteriovoracaceae bacterium]|nr:TetR/AcrR family transcriptional regulator [Bacteriovoracaceae bacterium]|tara:strand:- start:191121 stop:191786 length:666 start_codon:yes stop_codon:yes gene_type:complete
MSNNIDDFSHYKRKFTEQIILSEKQIYIIEGYLKLAEKLGVPNVTFQKLADDLKISLGSIHYHFGNKDGPNILDCAILHVSQESIKYINFYLDRALFQQEFEGIDTYIKILYNFCRTYPHHGRLWLYFYYLSLFQSKERESNQNYIPLMRERIEQVLTLSIGKGLYGPLSNIQNLSEKLHSVIIGALIISGGDKSDPLFERAQKNAIENSNAIIKTHEEVK